MYTGILYWYTGIKHVFSESSFPFLRGGVDPSINQLKEVTVDLYFVKYFF